MGYRQKDYKSEGYKLKRIKNRYGVKEVATGRTVQTFGYITEAREHIRKYSLGGGFNGWTPGFFLGKPAPIDEDDNA